MCHNFAYVIEEDQNNIGLKQKRLDRLKQLAFENNGSYTIENKDNSSEIIVTIHTERDASFFKLAAEAALAERKC